MKLKKTIVAKDIHSYTLNSDINQTHIPIAGELAVFQILELGRHEMAQMEDGKNRSIFPGDHIVAAFADRYATSQFEGYVPEQVLDQYHILGAGGVIGIIKSKNASLKDVEPTTVKLVGYCTDENHQIINTKFYQKERKKFTGKFKPKVILSIGSTMDSGKTTTAAFVTRGLAMGGHEVGFIKLTGTCYTRDREFVLDCGATVVTDFSDCGFPSTYMCSKEDILDIYQTLMDREDFRNLEYVVMEIADGLMQRETNFLLQDNNFQQTIYKTVFSCGDSLAALHGLQVLKSMNIEVTAVSGRFTMSPLLIQEVKEYAAIPVFTIDEVMTGEYNYLFDGNVVSVPVVDHLKGELAFDHS